MKKDTLLKVAVVFAVAMLYTNAYAAQTFTTTSSVSVGAQTVKPSNHVSIVCASNASQFAAQSSHSSGDRHFGTTYQDTKILWSTTSSMDSVTPSSSFGQGSGGWSAL